ncbi:chemotaxis protein CheW [Phenylobacterium sp. J367]|nr:chemotaxis protein CheW [Phenylobacterium sp. J367]
MTVREIRGWTASTPLPHAPAYVLGMINLRGVVLPVVDLAGLLGLARIAPDASSVVVVADIGGRPVGLLVDAVCDIVSVQDGDLQPPPELGSNYAGFVSGVIPDTDGIVTVLKLDGALPEPPSRGRLIRVRGRARPAPEAFRIRPEAAERRRRPGQQAPLPATASHKSRAGSAKMRPKLLQNLS